MAEIVDALDSRRGVLLSSSYEFPGRYARWTLGFADPPLELSGTGRSFQVRALNDRRDSDGGTNKLIRLPASYLVFRMTLIFRFGFCCTWEGFCSVV